MVDPFCTCDKTSAAPRAALLRKTATSGLEWNPYTTWARCVWPRECPVKLIHVVTMFLFTQSTGFSQTGDEAGPGRNAMW